MRREFHAGSPPPPYASVAEKETSWSVSVVWSLVTGFVVFASVVSLMEPDWWVNRARRIGFGPVFYRYGERPGGCVLCEYPAAPSWSLRHLSAVTYGMGSMLFIFSSVSSVTHLLFPVPPGREDILSRTACVQIAAGVLQVLGLLVYPLHLDSQWGRLFCGRGATSFNPEDCEMGWAYVLAIVACAISLYCPILARLAAPACEDDPRTALGTLL